MKYTKMHGLGNDFILCHDPEGEIKDYTELAKKLCARHTGVGADGLIVALPSDKADIRMRIINADGSEAEMCGNGIRCFAHYVFKLGLITTNDFTVETLAGIMKPQIVLHSDKNSLVTVDMGKPLFAPNAIPMNVDGEKVLDHVLHIDGRDLKVSVVRMGVPHAVVFVDHLDQVPLEVWGPLIEKHEVFPENTNVNFVEVVDEWKIKVRTWERGAGATLACGTGSCASVVVCYEKDIMHHKLDVELALGSLQINYKKKETGEVYMTGPAEEIFETELPAM